MYQPRVRSWWLRPPQCYLRFAWFRYRNVRTDDFYGPLLWTAEFLVAWFIFLFALVKWVAVP